MLSDTVLQWADELEKVIQQNTYEPKDYPAKFISSNEEQTHE